MPFYLVLLAIVLIFGGILLFKHGQSLPTADEDKDRDGSMLYEFLNGPPGYERARGLIGGLTLIIMGIIVAAFSVYRSLVNW